MLKLCEAVPCASQGQAGNKTAELRQLRVPHALSYQQVYWHQNVQKVIISGEGSVLIPRSRGSGEETPAEQGTPPTQCSPHNDYPSSCLNQELHSSFPFS